MAYCKQCGNELMPDSSFCSYCGAPVPQEPSPAPNDLPPVIPDTSPASADSPANAEPPAGAEPSIDSESPVTAEPVTESFAPAESVAPPAPEARWVEAPPAPLAYSAPPVPPVPPTYAAPPPPPTRVSKRSGPERITFVNSFLTIVLLGALLIAAPTLGMINSRLFLSVGSFETMIRQFSLYAMIALAVALSTRAKGPDLSIGSLMTLSAVFVAMNNSAYGSPMITILIAVGTCAIIGLINGVLINYAGISALVVTLLTNLLVRAVAYMLTAGQAVVVRNAFITSIAAEGFGTFILMLLAFVIAFLMILPSRLGTPLYRREKKHPVSYMFAYMGSAGIAALAGILMLSLYRGANSSMGSGYEPFILLVYGCIISSRALDNRIAPALYALAPALVVTLLNIVLLLLHFASPALAIVQCGLALVFILIGYLVRPELRGKILVPKQ